MSSLFSPFPENNIYSWGLSGVVMKYPVLDRYYVESVYRMEKPVSGKDGLRASE